MFVLIRRAERDGVISRETRVAGPESCSAAFIVRVCIGIGAIALCEVRCETCDRSGWSGKRNVLKYE